jgi:hypothetical protein
VDQDFELSLHLMLLKFNYKITTVQGKIQMKRLQIDHVGALSGHGFILTDQKTISPRRREDAKNDVSLKEELIFI